VEDYPVICEYISIPRRSSGSTAPLSYAQQRLWIAEQLHPGTPAYNIARAVRLTGLLDCAALEKSLGEIIRRHESLRTDFPIVHDQPVQHSVPASPFPLPLIDLHALPAVEREQVQHSHLQIAAQQPFDLTAGPLLRFSLLRLRSDEHVLLLIFHHSICDGWSLGIFNQELMTLYQSFTGSSHFSPLPELSIQYADFAQWQREWLQGSALAEQMNYWRQHLTNAPTVLALPTDHPRPAIQTLRGAVYHFTLSPALCEAIDALSKREGCTLFMLLLAAFQVLLARYTGRDDLLIGSPIAGRTRAEIEELIGFFVNTLVLRADLSGKPSFRTLLKRIREVCLDAYEHQDVPFEQLVIEMQPEHDLSRHPLIQVLFSFQNISTPMLALPGLQCATQAIATQTAIFDLALELSQMPEGIEGTFRYSTDLFEMETIERLVGHYLQLLESIATEPACNIWTLPLLTTKERQQLLSAWPRTTYPREQCLHERFEVQAEQLPDAIAILCEDCQLTYRELNQRANQLAYHLQHLGVGPEALVGIFTERSIAMVIALLGVLKAGGAYVALDPVYPKERLRFILEDTHLAVLLIQQHLQDLLPQHGARIVALDTLWHVIAQQQVANPTSRIQPENLSYVIYTSGSTGRPKGVAIAHRSVITLLDWARKVFTDEQLQGVLATTSICFDLSIFELFVPLSYGGKVILSQHPLELAPLLATREVTLINTVPSLLAELNRAEGLPPSVHTINLAGEPLSATLVQQLYQQETVKHIYNLYGPSEATTYSTYALISKTDPRPPTIGQPITNTQVYLLDHYLQPVPVGVPAELYIGGEGLARGYLHRPELTAERFIPHPFSSESGARLYKTGDLARYWSDGNIEFLGRIDQQVKIRGFRIELGEIEMTLRCHPAVQDAIVIDRDVRGEKQLVAYIITNEEQSVPAHELKDYLQSLLPHYMVPSAFVMLATFPLTPNGKIDRRALPAPERTGIERANTSEMPRDVIELQLMQLWEEILGIPRIGIQDNFFALGGHSLQAITLMTRIQQLFGRGLPLTHLLQGGTIEHLADMLRKQATPESRSPLVTLQPQGRRCPLFAVHPVMGDIWDYIKLARFLHPDQPLYGIQAPGIYGEQEPLTRIEEMAASYIAAVSTIQPEGPYQLLGYSFGGYVAFEMARQLQAQGKRVASLVLLDTPCHPEKWPEPEDNMGHLNADEQLDYLVEQLQGFAQIPSHVTTSSLRHFLKIERCNFHALAHYTPKVYPGRITLFRAQERSVEEAEDRDLGWSAFAAGGVNIYDIPGTHYTMLKASHVETIAALLEECLLQVQI